ncbi:heparinase II/III family protein [Pseudarthrobacter sp. PH31-O2]|uniref:heparinase II/III domain-containing protein n=1 Tax=Pseudarthrobacter sp. PH31-O2 TaxID=3046206 RepID=UPI0024BB1286|nr:heparinase II/III family protein [Pseudarthrobacter sp. PH31-O2]MDJ0351338.1 heparinase II/III family protein [Pseudarthrobacter sp. PH31-O2]
MSGLLAPPAFAATLSEQRASLRQAQYAATQDYVASRDYVALLARANGLAVKDAIASGLDLIKVVAGELTAASTQTAMTAVAVKMKAEVLRAATVKKGGQQLITLKDLRAKQQLVATNALADLVSGRIAGLPYEQSKARTGAFSTQLSADVSRQLAVLGQAVSAPALASPAFVPLLEQGNGSIPAVSGLVGVPGGCALPVAAPAFRPMLPADGPGVATNRQILLDSAAGAAADAATGYVHRQLLRAAVSESSVELSLEQLRTAYVLRTPRLGYGWLSGNDTKARDVLAADTKRILLAGPEGMTTLASSHLLLAASSAADWVKLTGLDETVLVRWLGPQTCLLEDREAWVKGPTNLGAIHNAANFTASAVFLKAWPELAAAMAQESLKSIQPALQMITADGGTQEGPGYWTYQSRAIAVLYSTLPNAYASLPVSMPSLEKVSNYAMNSTGPDGKPTPFADALPNELSALMPAWDARVRGDASVAAWVAGRFAQKPDAYLMWWRIPPGTLPAKTTTVYAQTGLAALQIPLGTATLKGGSNVLPHAHMDLGSISFYRRGIQWSVDPGPAPAGAPGYYSAAERFTYWNPGTSAHSTLSFPGVNQLTTAVAPVRRITSSSASVDLRQALPGTSTATRTVTHGSTSMVVNDVVRSNVAKDMLWQWVTDATVSIGTNRAALRRDGQVVTIAFSGVPAGAALTAEPAPGTSADGQALTVLKLAMPQVRSLDLTATAY